MNKTIIINISGVIFHIEEDAYEQIKGYLNEIKVHFSSYQDNLEIVSDIEIRISEMFSELLSKDNKQVITQADVEQIIVRMGKPAEFMTEDDTETQEFEFATKKSRKLYRDVDDRIVAGVSSGISHYFNIDPKWIRITFVLLIIFFGFGLIPYVILWLVLPKAVTRTEKMEMNGEKINIKTFQKSIEDELNELKANFVKAGKGGNSIGNFLATVTNTITKIALNILKVAVKVIGYALLLLISIGIILSFISFLAFFGYIGNAEVSTIYPLNALSFNLRAPVIISGFVLMFVPLIAIVLFMIKVLFKNNFVTKTLNFSLLMVWILALTTVVYCLAKNSADFKERATYSEIVPLNKNLKNTYILASNNERTLDDNFKNNNVIISLDDNDFETPNHLNFTLRITEKNAPYLEKSFSARGINYESAIKTAQEIKYFFKQKDSLLMFDEKFGLNDGILWRDQNVTLVLNIPINSVLYIETKFAKEFMSDKIYSCFNYSDDDDKQLLKVRATKDGLVCFKTEKALNAEIERNAENNVKEKIEPFIVF